MGSLELRERHRWASERESAKIVLLFKNSALAGVAQWIECQPANQRVAGLIPSQAHAWVVGQVPTVGGAPLSRGCSRGKHTLMFLTVFLLPFLSL